MTQDPSHYAPPGVPLERIGRAGSDAEFEAFVGEKAWLGYYASRWQGVREGRTQLAGFNWPAALFGLFWLGYRRLYFWILPFLALAFALQWIGASLALETGDPLLGLLGSVLFFVLCGLGANPLLYARARNVIANAPGDLHAIRQAGGTSETAVWILVALQMLPLLFTLAQGPVDV